MSLKQKIELVQFDGSNHTLWRFNLKMALAAHGVAGHAEGKIEMPREPDKRSEWEKLDAQAQLLINQSLTDKHKPLLFACNTSSEMLEKLDKRFAGKSALASQRAWEEFLSYRMAENAAIASHLATVQLMAKKLMDMGETVTERCIMTQVLRSLPKRLQGFKLAFNLMNEERKTIETLEDMLLNEDDEALANDSSRSAYLAIPKKGNKRTGNAEKDKKGSTTRQRECWQCHATDHIKANCPQRKQGSNARAASRGSGSSNGSNRVALSGVTVDVGKEYWLCDSGASCHMTNRRDWFAKLEPHRESIKVANKNRMWSTERGSINVAALINGSWVDRELRNVLLVPELDQHLFSVPAMRKQGWLMREQQDTITWTQNGVTACEALFNGNIYIMQIRVQEPEKYAARTEVQALHERMGHINAATVIKTIKSGAVDGVTTTANATNFSCDACDQAKQTRKALPPVKVRTTNVCDLIHADVAGPMPRESIGGSRYFLILKDDYSSYRKVYFLRHKSEVPNRWAEFVAEAERQTGRKVKALRSDNGTEFVNAEMMRVNNIGIRHEKSAPYTPASNGRAEREIRSLITLARTMFVSSGLPESLWAELVHTAAYVLNRTVTKNGTAKTPYEIWFGRKPHVSHMRTIGSTAYGHIDKTQRSKFDASGRKTILVGYDAESCVYRLYDQEKRDIKLFRHATIRDGQFESKPEEPLTYEFWYEPDVETGGADQQVADADRSQEVQEEDENDQGVVAPQQTSVRRSTRRDGEQTHYMLDEHNRPRAIQYADDRAEFNETMTQATTAIKDPDVPINHKEALASPQREQWLEAFKAELDSHAKNGTWILVDAPRDTNILDNKWVLSIKRKQDGSVDRYKARLVARGFRRQQQAIDYEEVFSPVVRYESVRILLTIAAEKDMDIMQFDVKTAYLYGELEKPKYMKQPVDFEDAAQPEKVCKLLKSIYGLPISGRAWNKRFVNTLKTLGFGQLDSDRCVFKATRDGALVILAIYVDDGLIMTTNRKEIGHVLEQLRNNFEIVSKTADVFVGMQIHRDRKKRTITVSQPHYVESILERFGMQHAKPVGTPMNTGTSLSKPEETLDVPYQELVGCLLFAAMVSRPDIANAVTILSRYLTAFGQQQWMAAKHVLRYLAGTRSYGLVFGEAKTQLNCYTDADYAMDVDTRKSTTGVIVMMKGAAVLWVSQRQSVVATSTTEAEFVALATGTKEALWLREFLNELGCGFEIVPMNVDNTAAIKLAENHNFHRRTKHISVRYHFVRDTIEQGAINVNYIESRRNLADILTKPLPKQHYESLREMIGVKPIIKPGVDGQPDRKWK